MPFIQRDDNGHVIAVSEIESAECSELVREGDPGLGLFLERMKDSMNDLEQSDFEIIRVIEDVVNLLIDKNIILFTELPLKAQEKLRDRKELRGQGSTHLNLLGDDDEKLY